MKLRDLTGQRFGQWLVLGRAESNVGKTGHSTYWNCLCDCGLIKQVATPSLQDLRSSCPCVKRREMIGKKFYQWTVIGGPFKPSYGNNLDWMCRCECGYEGTVTGTNLRRGGSKGCGCLNVKTIVQAATRHGLSKTLEYALFVAAKSRAKKNGIPFNLDLADIEIPDLCPVLGIPMFKATLMDW